MPTAESAVKRLALKRGLALFQPENLKSEEASAKIAAARPTALVVAAYGLILPKRALEIAPRGAINIHASLLPRWRGAAPVQRALLAGDRETGISIMQMDAGLDTGPVLAQHRLPIAADDDFQSLHDKLAELGARAIADALARNPSAMPQSETGATYAKKLAKNEEEIDWAKSCHELERQIRALRPFPVARTSLRGSSLKIWRARCVERTGAPGTVLEARSAGVQIACGTGALEVNELQRAGGARLAAAEFLRGFPVAAGERLGAAR